MCKGGQDGVIPPEFNLFYADLSSLFDTSYTRSHFSLVIGIIRETKLGNHNVRIF